MRIIYVGKDENKKIKITELLCNDDNYSLKCSNI